MKKPSVNQLLDFDLLDPHEVDLYTWTYDIGNLPPLEEKAFASAT